jgi:hypothetical protein
LGNSVVSKADSCDIITHFDGQDWASHIKISQITYFSCVFSGKQTLEHGETKWQIDAPEPSFDFHIVLW